MFEDVMAMRRLLIFGLICFEWDVFDIVPSKIQYLFRGKLYLRKTFVGKNLGNSRRDLSNSIIPNFVLNSICSS